MHSRGKDISRIGYTTLHMADLRAETLYYNLNDFVLTCSLAFGFLWGCVLIYCTIIIFDMRQSELLGQWHARSVIVLAVPYAQNTLYIGIFSLADMISQVCSLTLFYSVYFS